MKAIIETGGKQYAVEEGSIIFIEKLDNDVDGKVVFDKVLMANGVIGNPYLENAKVEGVIEKQGKQKKIIVYMYKPKKKERKTHGHRQPYTRVKITKIA
jgi:large subunit ribosomal protein L21